MRWIRVIACALAAAFYTAPAQAENVVRWATPAPLLTWDPHGSINSYNLLGYRHVYEGLTRLRQDFRLEPALATSWELVDPRTWRFELRPGVRFHDGSPLSAGAVAFSLEQARGEGSGMREWAFSLERVAVVGPSAMARRLWPVGYRDPDRAP